MDTPYTADKAALAALIASTTGPLAAAKLHLAIDMPALNPSMAVGDFTEATFGSYAAVTVTWGVPYYSPGGAPETVSQLIGWTSDDATSELIVGWYLTNAAGDALLAAGELESPVAIDHSGAGMGLAIAYRRYDGAAIVL